MQSEGMQDAIGMDAENTIISDFLGLLLWWTAYFPTWPTYRDPDRVLIKRGYPFRGSKFVNYLQIYFYLDSKSFIYQPK